MMSPHFAVIQVSFASIGEHVVVLYGLHYHRLFYTSSEQQPLCLPCDPYRGYEFGFPQEYHEDPLMRYEVIDSRWFLVRQYNL